MAKSSSKKAARVRRGGPRREARGVAELVQGVVRSPRVGWAVIVSSAFALVCGVLAAWAHEQPLAAVGRVMNETRLARVDFDIVDTEATERNRAAARQNTPRVLECDEAMIGQIIGSLQSLPISISGATTLADVDRTLRERFRLSEESFAAVKALVGEGGEVDASWAIGLENLARTLRDRPVIDAASAARVRESGSDRVELVVGTQTKRVDSSLITVIEEGAGLESAAGKWAQSAGYSGPLVGVIAARLTHAPTPTFRYLPVETSARQAAAADRVPDVVRRVTTGAEIFKRGDTLTSSQFELYRAELRHFRDEAESWRVWLRRLSLLTAALAVTAAGAGYISLFSPRIGANPGRMIGVAALSALLLGVAVAGSVWAPALVALTAVAPSVLTAVILVIAYDRRVALALGALHSVMVCIALEQPIGTFALTLTGIGVAVWQLAEIRDRRALVRMSVVTGISLAVAMVFVSLIDRPVMFSAIRQMLGDALLAGFGGLLVGGVTLFILPWIERTFSIVTGMTLIELRDPKHPLLRQLQQRAPGTYNHSLNVASIAETAADAIGADALLTYVGALYHDVGKMSKPDYFVENQTGGPNKHDKLSPAMSLLVIVGHVKDGLEMAREFGLPKALFHFIEAHHGTTLVEYFYHRAKRQKEQSEAAEREAGKGGKDASKQEAAGEGKEPVAKSGPPEPEEFDYRYPGPRPRRKEVAILMLADAVESAARTMSEPTAARIDQLVRSLATKRLMDGQFDECDLTLRELRTISESIAKSVTSIYHGRIAYPAGEKGEKKAEAEEKRA